MRAVLKEVRFKKIIAIILVFLCCLFLFYALDSLRYPRTYLYNARYDGTTANYQLSKIKADENSNPKNIHKGRDYSKLDDLSGNEDDILSYYLRRPHTDYVKISGTQTLEQTFVAQDDKLKRLQLFFHNPGSTATEGTVEVSVLDENGKTICTSDLSAGLVINDSLTGFDFTQDTEAVNANKINGNKVSAQTSDGYSLKKGDTYTIQIKFTKVKTDKENPFGIYLGRGSYQDATLTVDGTAYGKTQLLCGVNYLHMSYTLMGFFFGCMLLVLILILLPLDHISEGIRNLLRRRSRAPSEEKLALIDLNRTITRILFCFTPFFCYWLVWKGEGKELHWILNIKRIFTNFSCFMTVFILIMVMLIFYLLFNRMQYAALMVTFLTFALCMANYFLILFRNEPLVATDFSSIGTAMDVAANYTLSFTKRSLWLIIMGGLYMALLLSLNGRRGLKLKQRAVLLIVCGLWVGWFYGVILNTNFLNHHGVFVSGFNAKGGYQRHGSVVGFVYTVKNSRIEKPSDYSVEKVEDAAAGYISDTTDGKATVSEENPNIIVIMDEAFTDFSLAGDVETSSDYLPFYHSLKENTIKGTLYPSIFGGRTADTEFECLTGNSLQFYPLNAVPYNTNIKTAMPSLATTLKSQGYKGNIAFHPGVNTSYNRNNVYPLLGFDKYISQENLKDPEKIRAYISDSEDFKQIQKNYESYKKKKDDSPFFLFNVTIQNHSDFKLTSGKVEQEVTITDGGLSGEQANQYINLAKRTDEALEELLTYFESVEEPTMIVFFGDHDPHVESAFYDTLKERMGEDAPNIEKRLVKYQVPFMVWTNYDNDKMKETDDLKISGNYISSYLLSLTGNGMTGYQKYLLDLQKKVPVTSAVAYQGDDGKFYSATNTNTKYYLNYLSQYHLIQYNNTVDTENRISNFYDLQEGSKDITENKASSNQKKKK